MLPTPFVWCVEEHSLATNLSSGTGFLGQNPSGCRVIDLNTLEARLEKRRKPCVRCRRGHASGCEREALARGSSGAVQYAMLAMFSAGIFFYTSRLAGMLALHGGVSILLRGSSDRYGESEDWMTTKGLEFGENW